ncbi:hypothetical protein MRX96_058061 [Rhipicephalus microplus]
MVNAEQATKIFNNKKVTIVVRDCAQAIWGEEALACKTVSGCSVPVEETKQLTPQKVHDVNGDAVMSVMHNMAAHYQDNPCKLITQLHGPLHNSLLDILPSASKQLVMNRLSQQCSLFATSADKAGYTPCSSEVDRVLLILAAMFGIAGDIQAIIVHLS